MLRKIALSAQIIAAITFTLSAQEKFNSSEILQSIKKLNSVGSVLYVAAHPDDENTRLITWMANEKKLRTGYLSLTRGDGGQNLIGKEQAEYLGLIRTQELLAARRIDGGEQFFTRANDFGYSKSPEEAFEIWNKDSILADVVWTIRKFQPDIIVCRFFTDGCGGHGHHTASALLAEEAYDAAADPKRFPSQLKYVSVWQAKRLVWNSYSWTRKPGEIFKGEIKLNVGQYNVLLGKSYGEIASESRSCHKSQGFGNAKNRGEAFEFFKVMKGDKDTTDLFKGFDFTWKRVQGSEKFAKLLEKIIKEYNIEKPSASLPSLVTAYKELANIKDEYWKTQKRKELEQIITDASGVFAEAAATDFTASPGTALKIGFTFLNRTDATIKLDKVIINNVLDTTINKTMEDNKPFVFSSTFKIPENTYFTNPYWLDKPLTSKGLFNVQDQNLIGIPENKAAFEAIYLVSIMDIKFNITRPVIYKWVEPSDGEKYRSLEISPPVTANIEERAYVYADNQPKTVKITLKSTIDNTSGNLKIEVPAGWKLEPSIIPFTLKTKGEEIVLSAQLSAKAITQAGEDQPGTLKAFVEINSKTYNKSISRVNYPHIPMQALLYDAEAKLVQVELIKKGLNIGYIPGAGDNVARSLEQVGYKVTILDDNMITNGNLSGYDAIVTGIRAYNTNDRMKVYYKKLMDYISNGGNLVVQYNTNNWIGGIKSDIGPYKFTINRDRVTKEEAPMNFDKPEHPILNTPNKITSKDFEGWIQERGIYFVDEKDLAPEYQTVFSCNDPGEKPMKGSLIVAKYGKGNFVYTGLVFFRELPAGVRGAYRLFANIINLKQ
jgi:LmbE family N-acetylglucosaminyl deacetylase